MTKLPLKEATNQKFLESISEILKLSLPAKLSYKLTKISAKVDEEVKLFDAERKKLLKKYCFLDENGDLVIKDNKADFKSVGDAELFTKEVNELVEVCFDCETIKLDELENVKDLKGMYISGIFPIIVEN